MTKTMKKIPALLLAGVIAAAFAFAIGTFTTQETYAENYAGSAAYRSQTLTQVMFWEMER